MDAHVSPVADADSSGWTRLRAVAPGVALVAVLLAVMWAEELVDLLPGVHLNRIGIRPRTWRGLLGIVVAPFLHVDLRHLIANTIPFAVLGAVIAWGGRQRFVEVTLATGVVSGLGVWLLGRSGTVHLGASGLVFGYVAYLIARGLFARKATWILGGLVVAVMYSGLIWGLFPTSRVSWLGHLFGAVGGVLAAWLLHGRHDLDRDDPADPAQSRRTA